MGGGARSRFATNPGDFRGLALPERAVYTIKYEHSQNCPVSIVTVIMGKRKYLPSFIYSLQHNTTQHNTTQHNTTQQFTTRGRSHETSGQRALEIRHLTGAWQHARAWHIYSGHPHRRTHLHEYHLSSQKC